MKISRGRPNFYNSLTRQVFVIRLPSLTASLTMARSIVYTTPVGAANTYRRTNGAGRIRPLHGIGEEFMWDRIRALFSSKQDPERERIRKTSRRLDVARLMGMGEVSGSFSLSEVLTDQGPVRLFGYYSADGIKYALEALGVFDILGSKGYQDLSVSVSGNAFTQDLRIHGRADGLAYLLVEGRFRRTAWSFPKEACPNGDPPKRSFQVVVIEWFLLQNPRAQFTDSRPRLPGQKHPGLGMRDQVLELFQVVARRLDLDAYVAQAKLFHNAFMYSPMLLFTDPRRQAELSSIRAAAGQAILQDITLAMEGGFLLKNREQYQWTGAEMIHPLSETLIRAFRGCSHQERVVELTESMHFQFDWEAYQRSKDSLAARAFNLEEGRVGA
jgi:hypothetical protein